MNKSDLVANLSKRITYITRRDIEEGISVLLSKLSASLESKERVEIRGFGSFSCRKREARIGRNPKTGTSIHIYSKYHVYFRASRSLVSNLNQ